MVLPLRCLHAYRTRAAGLEARAGLATIGGVKIDAIERRTADAHLRSKDPLDRCNEDTLGWNAKALACAAPVDNRRMVPIRGSIGGGPVSRLDI